MTLHFEGPAETEIFEIADFYDTVRKSLSDDFGESVFRRLDEILIFPESQPRVSKKFRKASVPGFPYHIIYQIREEEVWVIAIWHNKRKPGSWKKRLS